MKTNTIRRIPLAVWACATICSLAAFISIFCVLSRPEGGLNLFRSITKISKAHDQSQQGITATGEEEEDRPLILYAYHETDNARQNALFFINHALHSSADFIFILNGETNLSSSIPSHHPNIKVIQRNNTCFDLGAHAEILNNNGGELVKKYKKFILLNASIRGPFLPTWSGECWSDVLLAKVTDTNKLVGISYNCLPTRHIQSMLLATDRTGLATFLPVISHCFQTLPSAVTGELSITSSIHKAGYSVFALMTAFSSYKGYEKECEHGDLLYDGLYYGITMHMYESMFVKANRDNAPEVLERMTEWTEGWGYESWGVCGRGRGRGGRV